MVNEDKNTRLIDALKAEVDALRKQLAEKESRLGLAPPVPITLYERVEVGVCTVCIPSMHACMHAWVGRLQIPASSSSSSSSFVNTLPVL